MYEEQIYVKSRLSMKPILFCECKQAKFSNDKM